MARTRRGRTGEQIARDRFRVLDGLFKGGYDFFRLGRMKRDGADGILPDGYGGSERWFLKGGPIPPGTWEEGQRPSGALD
jgi:hypothetical protein